jgi:hypothetical protein
MRHAINEIMMEGRECEITMLLGDQICKIFIGMRVVCYVTHHAANPDEAYYNAQKFIVVEIDIVGKTIDLRGKRYTMIRDENGRRVATTISFTIRITFAAFQRGFEPGYGITAHGCQGDTYDFAFCITELGTMPTDGAYTVAGRATKSEHLQYPDEALTRRLLEKVEEIRRRDYKRILEVMEERVKGYKKQDRDNKFDLRKIPKNDYVDAAYLLTRWIDCDGICDRCERPMTITGDLDGESRVVTYDRYDNSKPHIKDDRSRMRCHCCNSADTEWRTCS